MPLVVPGVTADNVPADKAQEWMEKLAGKTLTEGPSSETVNAEWSSFLAWPALDTLADKLYHRLSAKPNYPKRHGLSSLAQW